MEFELEQKLEPNLKEKPNKVSADLCYEVKENGTLVELTGNVIFERVVRDSKEVKEIINRFPIDITIPKVKLTNSYTETRLYLKGFNFEFQDDSTLASLKLELTNVHETKDGGEKEPDLFDLIK